MSCHRAGRVRSPDHPVRGKRAELTFTRRDAYATAVSQSAGQPAHSKRFAPSQAHSTCERVDRPRGQFIHANRTGAGGRVASGTYTV